MSRWGMAKGLLWLLWQAAGLGPQRCLLVESLVKLQADTAESAQGAERKRAEQVAKGQTTKASTLLRREVPVLVLRGDGQVQQWLDWLTRHEPTSAQPAGAALRC